MIKYVPVFIVMIFFFSCAPKPETVNIGLRTKLLTSDNTVLPPQEALSEFFINHLKLADHSHYPGKFFLLFDTVYSSAISVSQKRKDDILIPEKANVIGKKRNDNDQESFFYRNGKFFIYRTMIPEKDFRQIILVDIASKDSTKISGYFADQKMNTIITQ